MTTTSKTQSAIIRTERGLTIAGTCITLYDVMDYLTAKYPPRFIQGLFNLTDEQIDGALAYIEERRVEVEAEYQIVLKEASEIQKYWEERNRERLAQIAKLPPPPGREAAWEKLQQHKARLQTQLNSQA